jgi:hypothetical protein
MGSKKLYAVRFPSGINYMSEHGNYDKSSGKWYCSYWMSAEEWENIHGYAPSQ